MKKTFGSRIALFMLAMLMVVGVAIPASAAECDDVYVVAEETYVTTPRVYYWPCQVNEIISIQVNLSSYIGITKTFTVDTLIYSGSSGTIKLTLYNPDGTVRFENYVMNVGDTATWKFTLPSSGTYILIVDNYSDCEVGIFPHWS